MGKIIQDTAVESRTIRFVDYLIRLAALRDQPMRDIDQCTNVLWISDIPRQKGCFAQAWGRDEDFDSDVWVQIQSRREPEVPMVPSACRDWIEESALKDNSDLPSLIPQITIQRRDPSWDEESDLPEFISHSEQISDHPEVQEAWERYLEGQWLPWDEEHRTWESIHRSYASLFEIHQELLRRGEELELVLGLGLLTWHAPNGNPIRRHLIVANATLEFEARLGRFTVRPLPDGADVRPELDMLDIEDQPTRAEQEAKSLLTDATDDPWERSRIDDALRTLVHSLDPHGDYLDDLQTRGAISSARAIVEYAPAVILRKRSARGLTDALKRIRVRIEQGEPIPAEFADLAEVHSSNGAELDNPIDVANMAYDGEVFFPKPSNEEQRRIVEKLQSASGVLVQGPPGTGKSHTIANLICHLLATGQRVLITAKTPRALQVLEGLVPEELRPLCVNLLGTGLEEKRSLESSVGGILRKNEEWNERTAAGEGAELEKRLRALRQEKAKIDRQLREIRESETHSTSIAEGAYRGTAARIAEAVNRDRCSFEWFTDTPTMDTACPITENLLPNLLANLRAITPELRRELELAWPDDLPSPEQIAHLIKCEEITTEQEAVSAIGADQLLADHLAEYDVTTIEVIRDALFAYNTTLSRLVTSIHPWMHDALLDVMGGNLTLWRELSRVTRDVIASIETIVSVADDTSLDYPNSANVRALLEDVCILMEYCANGGKLGWGPFRSKPVRDLVHVLKTVRVNGRLCSSPEQLGILADALRVRVECEKAWRFWGGRCAPSEGPYALQLQALRAECEELDRALALDGLIRECRRALTQCPHVKPAWANGQQIEQMVASCRLALARHATRFPVEELRSVEVSLACPAGMANVHPVVTELLLAVRNRDFARYVGGWNALQGLIKDRQTLLEMDQDLQMLSLLAPRLAEHMLRSCADPCWDARIQQIQAAWRWAQAKFWVEEYVRKEDSPSLEKLARQIEEDISSTITRLAALRAWSFCFSRLKENHRRHMEAWRQSMGRLGKGTGKHAPRHRREAQEHLNECREAVPAWVMPLHRVWDTVDAAPGMFDVVIVDEASQCGVESLPLFYLGQKILIVGDDKQISPDAVGVPRDAVHRLMEEFLNDFQYKSSFDIESSLFDHGRLRYGTRKITLREHFRCMPEIIAFSNALCYSDTPLIPLRQYGPDRLTPLERVFVSGGYREGRGNRAQNRPEAEALVKKIIELSGNPRYLGKTMGVVVLQGEAQATLVERELLERLGAEEMDKRRLICGNPYSFQGDERDVILLSMVAAPNEQIGPLTRSADERRFNVATSRARDQMFLFHSVSYSDLSERCLRRRLLQFFENTSPPKIADTNVDELERRAAQDNRSIVRQPLPFDSWFEVDVALELRRRGFRVIPQYPVAEYRIDLVVEGSQTRLAIECDGDAWHGADRYEADMQRQRRLERCGWMFFRVRESAFYSNRDDVLQDLWRVLEERGILPFVADGSSATNPVEREVSSDRYRTGEVMEGDRGGDAPPLPPLSSASAMHIRPEHRASEVALEEIRNAILKVLFGCPNNSCTVDSITQRVLKELGILKRGNPRVEFEKRVMRALSSLERQNRIEKYKAKNRRIRLVRQLPS
ncbi:MAG: AAA domain-containing protein [Anaerolineae bacterium]